MQKLRQFFTTRIYGWWWIEACLTSILALDFGKSMPHTFVAFLFMLRIETHWKTYECTLSTTTPRLLKARRLLLDWSEIYWVLRPRRSVLAERLRWPWSCRIWNLSGLSFSASLRTSICHVELMYWNTLWKLLENKLTRYSKKTQCARGNSTVWPRLTGKSKRFCIDLMTWLPNLPGHFVRRDVSYTDIFDHLMVEGRT